MRKPAKPRTGGRLIVDALIGHGVDRAFCLPGESYLEVLNAVYDVSNEIRLVVARHEHSAGNMAEAYGKLTGKPGICLVTRGPGACNASIAVHTAKQDSTPMILLVGQVSRVHRGREAFQEIDYEEMFGSFAKWAKEIQRPDDIPEIMARAFQVATSDRPGPVVLSLPVDMLQETSTVADVPPLRVDHPAPKTADLQLMRDMLSAAERPLILIGGSGWTDEARRGLVRFVEANNLAVCCSFRRHDLFDNNHPNFIGELTNGLDPRLAERVKKADLIIAVGGRISDVTTQHYTLIEAPRPAQKLVHVYPDAKELNRIYRPDLAIHAGIAEFVAALATLKPVDASRWREATHQAHREYEETLSPTKFNTGYPLDSGAVMVELRKRMTPDAIVTVDAGNFSGWPQRYLTFGPERRLLASTSGAMGYGVPAAVMAKIVAPQRMVIACCGDGGFGMTGSELATAVQYGAAPIVLIFNNRMYGSIRGHQERHHPERVIATELRNPDYVAFAKAHGAHGELVERTEDFGPAFDRAVASGKAALIELRTDPEVISTRLTIEGVREVGKKARAAGGKTYHN